MAILKVARMGHPVLVRKADPVDPSHVPRPEFQRFINDMIETMRDAPGVGLAAPQVHVPLRLFVMDPGPTEAGREGLAVVVNPELTFPGPEKIRLWEGCLSVPGIRGLTERWAEVEVRCLDRDGRERTHSLEGFPAAVVQHETDHLDGLLFLSRMPDLTEVAFEEEYARYRAENDSPPSED
jgi:peptide deformylase